MARALHNDDLAHSRAVMAFEEMSAGSREWYTDQAAAAIDAIADVDRIAAAVARAQDVPFVGPRKRKIAAAVVAWMKDQS